MKKLPDSRYNYRFEEGDEVEPRKPITGLEDKQCPLDLTGNLIVFKTKESEVQVNPHGVQIIYLKGYPKTVLTQGYTVTRDDAVQHIVNNNYRAVIEEEEIEDVRLQLQAEYNKRKEKYRPDEMIEVEEPFWAGDFKLKGEGYFPVEEVKKVTKPKSKELRTVKFNKNE